MLPRKSSGAGRADRLGVALVVVDVQYDFLPGGALAVPDSESILPCIQRLLESEKTWDTIVLTQDYHPRGHVSFASSHPGAEASQTREIAHPLVPEEKVSQVLWPDHCIQGTQGVRLHSSLLSRVKRLRQERDQDVVIIRKGSDADIDAYSGLSDNAYSRFSPLVRYLQSPLTVAHAYGEAAQSKTPIDIAVVTGLATDYCVVSTAMDLLKFGYRTVVARDTVRGVDAAGSQAALDKIAAAGGLVVDTVSDALTTVEHLRESHGSAAAHPSYLRSFIDRQQAVWGETMADLPEGQLQ
ncbi:unnamed protein product [Parajaminaea phylloscopi]